MTTTNDENDEIPRQRFFDLLPKRSIAKIVVLLGMLVAIVFLQRQSGSIAGCVQSGLFPERAPRSGPTEAR